MSLSAHARLTISDDDRDLPGAFGGGCASLLEGVAEEGSLNRCLLYTSGVVRVGVAQVVPAGAREGVHGIRLAASRCAAHGAGRLSLIHISSGMMPYSVSIWRTLSGFASGLSHLLTATMIGTPAALEWLMASMV